MKLPKLNTAHFFVCVLTHVMDSPKVFVGELSLMHKPTE